MTRAGLFGSAAGALALFGAGRLASATPTETSDAGAHGATAHAAPVGTVDAARNGFDPHAILTDFDWGRSRRTADGRTVREWTVVAQDKEIEVAPGVRYAAWTYNGRVPGPTFRAREGERMRVRFVNGGSHPHTMHFHGIHPAAHDGVPGTGPGGLVRPGEEFTYEFEARPFGLHLYHCHSFPLAMHIAKGLYGAFIVDPRRGREDAHEMVMVQNAFDTNFDGANEVYAVNTVAFAYFHTPIRVRRGELVRIYLVNIVEYDPVNSFHLHGNFFHHYPTGTSLEPAEYTDTVSQVQGQRGILEMRFPYPGRYMFHAHKSEFAELGWVGLFEVTG
ncbi:MAG TPA: multicopper oxidase domain-containing protein [Miltoncostaeaceae bacterium]|nr:multicopper oxidase domain-containing protein [Miltoncostaeaceae bacterium]